MRKKLLAIGLIAALATTSACSIPNPFDNKEAKETGVVKKLATYTGLTVSYSVTATEATDENVAAKIESNLSTFTEKQPKSYKAKEGDVVNIDYKGLKDGVAFDGGTAEGYDLTLGSNTFIDGFEEGLIGVKTGDKKDLNLKFPDEYSSEELAGQEVVFKVTVNSISTPDTTKDLTDDFVANKIKNYTNNAGENIAVSNVTEYTNAVKEDMQTQYDEAAAEAKKQAVWKELLDNSEFEYSDEGITNLKESVDSKNLEAAQSNGYETLEEYITGVGSTLEEYNKQIEELVKQELASRLLTSKIAKKEDLELSDEEMQKEKEAMVEKYHYDSVEAMEKYAGADVVEFEIQREKVKNWLLENNKFELSKK